MNFKYCSYEEGFETISKKYESLIFRSFGESLNLDSFLGMDEDMRSMIIDLLDAWKDTRDFLRRLLKDFEKQQKKVEDVHELLKESDKQNN